MGNIESWKDFHHARIRLADGSRVMIFFNYKNGKCTGIRLWKITKGFFSIPTKLIWAMGMAGTRFLQGWFWKEEDFGAVICENISDKKDLQELKNYLIKLEEIIEKYLPDERLAFRGRG